MMWHDGGASRFPALRGYAGRQVLVVGSTGFIGAGCVDALCALDARVTVLNRRPDVHAAARGLRQIVGDVRTPEIAHAATVGQSVVLDFLGTVPAVESNRDPEKSLAFDCAPHLGLLQACARVEPRPVVVFPSSRLVYGRPRSLPVGEDHPLQPQSMYAVHKLAVEGYLRVFSEIHQLPHVVLRISNPYGPAPDGSMRNHGILNQFVRLALEGKALRVFGDGSQQRDYIYLGDLVETLLLAALAPSCRNGTFNLGGKAPISLVSAAHLISEACGGPGVVHVQWPPDAEVVETGDYASDTRLLERRIGPLPATSFAEGIQRTLAHYRGERDATLCS